MHRSLIALVLLVLPVFATGGGPGSGVRDDSDWSFRGHLVNFDVTQLTDGSTVITAVDSSGFSAPVPCTVNAQGQATSSGAIETPEFTYFIGPTSGYGARAWMLRNQNHWVCGYEARKRANEKKAGQTTSCPPLGGGGRRVALPAPSVVIWPLGSPGDEVVSLPQPNGWIVGH